MTTSRFRHSNRYQYWYERVYTIEEMKKYFHPGWHELIDSAFDLVSHFPDVQICSSKRCLGMLHMFARAPDPMIMHAVEGILWKIERLSSTICEHCGKRGTRRKELKNMYCLCTDCYTTFLNESEDPIKLFKRGKESRFY